MDISKHLSNGELDTLSGKPLYLQIAELIADKIHNHVLPAETKLPPERELAELFAVSRTTAINAYRWLEQQDLIRTRVGSGTYVASQADTDAGDRPDVPWPQLFTTYPQTPSSSVLREIVTAPVPDTISLALGMPDPDFYPIEIFTDLYSKHIEHTCPADFGYIPAEGYDPLRQAVAEMLTGKGMPAAKDNIMIPAGSQQGLYLLCKTFLEPGDYVVAEAPTFIGAIQVFQSAGAKVLNLPATEKLSLSLLEDYIIRYRPKMLYVMPTYQNPTGRVLSLQDRRNLLQLAARHRLVIVEDDPYSDLYYGEQPPPALKTLDSYGGVVYLGTFSKNLVPGLRTGYIAAPPVLINRLALEKQYIDLHTSNINQWLVAMFLSNGYLNRHLSRVRQEYKKRRDMMAKALRRYCGNYIDFTVPDGGFYYWCKIKQSGVTSRRLLQEAAKNGISFVPGEAFYSTPAHDNEFRLCFTVHNETILVEGVQRLAKSLAQLVKNKKDEQPLPYTPATPII